MMEVASYVCMAALTDPTVRAGPGNEFETDLRISNTTKTRARIRKGSATSLALNRHFQNCYPREAARFLIDGDQAGLLESS